MKTATSTTALASLLSLCLFSPAIAADFPGTLKGVTITDAQATNQPPVASFTYAIKGSTVTFDASGSHDPDGTITKYKWDFGNNITAEGASATTTLIEGTSLNVTLTVVDNTNGVALSQQTVAAAPKGIYDDFSTDTTANYTVMTGKALNVTDGALRTLAWSTTVAYHNTSLESNDHSIEADIVYAAGYGGGLLVRCDPAAKTGYLVYLESGRIVLNKFVNGTVSYLALYDGKYADGTYKIKIEITGISISVAVNGSTVLNKTDTSFQNGTHVGVRLRSGADPYPVTVDNIIGNKL